MQLKIFNTFLMVFFFVLLFSFAALIIVDQKIDLRNKEQNSVGFASGNLPSNTDSDKNFTYYANMKDLRNTRIYFDLL